jgi:phosphoketolase
LKLINANWRAANYLSVGQIYLYDNPLRKLLQAETADRQETQSASSQTHCTPHHRLARPAK